MTICNWETNRTCPQLRLTASIVVFLGYSPHYPQSDSLGKRILAHRRFLGLGQRELAHRLGIDQSTLGRWERGISSPSKSLLERLNVFLTPHLSDVAEPEQ